MEGSCREGSSSKNNAGQEKSWQERSGCKNAEKITMTCYKQKHHGWFFLKSRWIHILAMENNVNDEYAHNMSHAHSTTQKSKSHKTQNIVLPHCVKA